MTHVHEGNWFTSTDVPHFLTSPVAHAVWLVDSGDAITYCTIVQHLRYLRERTTGDLTCPDCWVAISGARPTGDAA
jgi:hypothetical protein